MVYVNFGGVYVMFCIYISCISIYMICSMEYVYPDLSQQMLLLLNQGQDAIVGEFLCMSTDVSSCRFGVPVPPSTKSRGP